MNFKFHIALIYIFVLLKLLSYFFFTLYQSMSWMANRSAADIDMIYNYFLQLQPVVDRVRVELKQGITSGLSQGLGSERGTKKNKKKHGKTKPDLQRAIGDVTRAIEYIVNSKE
jgi:hypothetical protein